MEIGQQEIRSLLEGHEGPEHLRAALEQARASQTLVSVLGRFIHFNAAFGAGVANLAGEVAARDDLFRDAHEPVTFLADRAIEVAADFFHAAIDEFDDRATPWRDTHRTLARATLKALCAHLGVPAERLDELVRMAPAAESVIRQVRDGYGIGARLDDTALFRAMGFHVGSEVLADREFTVIDEVLRARHPALVRALETETVPMLGARHNAYYWIHIHTSVETDHFEAALLGVNKALRYHTGRAAALAAKQSVLDGFARFAALEAGFMAGLSVTS